ncbi:MAG: hypothetical protein ACK44P_01455 [Bacteroidota bacterium]|jgi:hypothetical protein
MDPSNFWVWFGTEVFFAIFVALMLYYFFKQTQPKDKDDKPGQNGR